MRFQSQGFTSPDGTETIVSTAVAGTVSVTLEAPELELQPQPDGLRVVAENEEFYGRCVEDFNRRAAPAGGHRLLKSKEQT